MQATTLCKTLLIEKSRLVALIKDFVVIIKCRLVYNVLVDFWWTLANAE